MNIRNSSRKFSDEFRSLLEMTLKDISRRQERKKILKSVNCRVWYWGIRRTEKLNYLTIYFKCLDSKGSGQKHLVRIILDSYPNYLEKYKDLKPEEIVKRALNEGEIRIHCVCSDFLFGGYAYIADKKKYGIVKEPRAPHIRNPREEGAFCKHCSATLSRANLFIKSIMIDLNKGNFKKSVRIKTGDKVYVI